MKQKDIDIVIEILERQLGRKPSDDEIKDMSNLLSVQVKNVKKTKKTLEALKEVYDNERCSWFDGQYERNKNSLDKTGIFYRGNKITKKEMYSRAIDIAKALHANGLRKGDVFACCVSNIPDLITTLLATSYIGATIHIFDSSFDSEYIKEIINNCDVDFMFCSDDQYNDIVDVINDTKVNKKILLSLADHLPDKFPSRYEKMGIPRELYDFPNKAIQYAENDESIILIDDFIDSGKIYPASLVKDYSPSIYDVFTITHSSGSSRPGRPKAIVHDNLSYLTMMRFHDQDISGLPDLSDIVGLAHIPPISDTNDKSVISDTMGQGSIVACEPIYGADTFVYSIIMNEPNFVDATRSSWIKFAKDILFDSKFSNVYMPYLALPLSVGESLEVNERKFVDKSFAYVNAGREKIKELLGIPVPHTFLGEGGGRCESGGIVYTVFQGVLENLFKFKLKKGKYGMEPTSFADVAIIDKRGRECKVNQVGELCADSPCTMNGYLFDDKPEVLIDNYFREWPRFGAYAYRNEIGNIVMKGRMGNEFEVHSQEIPEFVLNDIVLSDRKRILSSEVVNYNNRPVVDIEINPFALVDADYKKVMADVLVSIDKKFRELLPEELSSKAVYRVSGFERPYPLTHCAKRDVNGIIDKKLENCVKPVVVDGYVCLIDAYDYVKMNDNVKYTLVERSTPLSKVVSNVKKKIKKIKND